MSSLASHSYPDLHPCGYMSTAATRTNWTPRELTDTQVRLLLGRGTEEESMRFSIETSLLNLDYDSSQYEATKSSSKTPEADRAEPADVAGANLDAAQTLIKEYLLGNPFKSERDLIEKSAPGTSWKILLTTEALGPERRATQIGTAMDVSDVRIHYNRALHETIEPLIHTLFGATTKEWRSALKDGDFFKANVNEVVDLRAKSRKGIDIQFRAHIHDVKLERPVNEIWVSVGFTKLDPVA